MNVPNMLTLSRFVLIPIFVILYLQREPVAALMVLLFAGLTDILDGYIARRSGQVTAIGVMLDPLADKLMMLAVVLVLLLTDTLPWPAFAVLTFREVGMILTSTYFHLRKFKTVPANIYGKATTVLYYAAVLLMLLELQGGVPVLWCGIALSFVASAVYFAKFRKLNWPSG